MIPAHGGVEAGESLEARSLRPDIMRLHLKNNFFAIYEHFPHYILLLVTSAYKDICLFF